MLDYLGYGHEHGHEGVWLVCLGGFFGGVGFGGGRVGV